MDFDEQFFHRFEKLYGARKATKAQQRLKKLLHRYEYLKGNNSAGSAHSSHSWSENDAILITYGDVVYKGEDNEPGLQTLERFMDEHIGDAVSTVHILPFFPSSSDSGFAVIDYKKVREDLGDWKDIKEIAGKYRLMADLVINHTSRKSQWFKNYEKGEGPGKNFFIEVDPAKDFSSVIRPRSSPLITSVETASGLRYVWTTFSDDQIDLNFSNPDVLFAFLDIFLFYLSQGVKVVRLDAIAYLWKRVGTSSIHLDETHEVVKLFRDIADYLDSHVTLITETNVPFSKNITYFGKGDETHMIYQFSLPPLLLHAILTENGHYLTEWASGLPDPPNGGMYLNFTSSHDGIGVRPLEGLVPADEFEYLVESTKERGGFISYRANPNGTQSPYELNITYFDAFKERGKQETDRQMERYMCSQIIMLSLKGVPGIYFHNFTATHNNIEGVVKTGHRREINRKKWPWHELEAQLSDETSVTRHVLHEYKKLLNKRKEHPAFHPMGKQKIFDLGSNLFALLRTSPDKSERIMVISNLTRRTIIAEQNLVHILERKTDGYNDILSETRVAHDGALKLEAFQTVWLEL